MPADLLRFDRTLPRDPAIQAWFAAHPGPLGEIARHSFEVMRSSGDEVREVLHDGCPVACFGDYPFAHVNVFRAHVNVAFYQGAALPDPAHLLQGEGKRMRHVKIIPPTPEDEAALMRLIAAAYAHIKSRVEHG